MTGHVGVLTVAILAVAAGGARAEIGGIDAEHCTSLDPAALDAAVNRELRLDPELARRAAAARVEIECADGIHALVRIDPGGTGSALSRELDLSEEPPALRVKLVALAIAELIDLLAKTPAPHVALAPAVDTEDDPPPIVRAVVAPSPAIGVAIRGGLRLIAGDADPMATLAADLEVGPVRVGLVTAVGDRRRDAGRPYMLAVTLSRAVVCSHGLTSVCLVARGEGGFVGASFRADDTRVMDRSVYAGYGDLAVGFEVRRRLGDWTWIADVDLGVADGLVVESPDLEHLDGPFAVAALGLIW